MSEDPTPAPADDAQAGAAPAHEEYLTSGRRFVRWNLVTLVLGLVALAVGLLVIKQQRAAEAQPGAPGEHGGARD